MLQYDTWDLGLKNDIDSTCTKYLYPKTSTIVLRVPVYYEYKCSSHSKLGFDLNDDALHCGYPCIDCLLFIGWA